MQPIAFSDGLYSMLSRLALLVWVVPEVIGQALHRPEKTATVRDRGSHLGVHVSLLVGIALAFVVSGRVPGAAIPWARLPLYWAGIVMMLGGVALRWYSIRVLGRFFTWRVATRSGQPVVQDGPYRLIRHPSYTGIMAIMLGIGLMLGNWLGLVPVLVVPLAGLLYRMSVEEAALLEAIGEPYRDYMRRTRRLIPFIY